MFVLFSHGMKAEYIEFSKIYKRVMDIELKLKERLYSALLNAFRDNVFYVLEPFINKNFEKRTFIKDIVYSNRPYHKKLKLFIKMIYLSDVVTLITNYKKVHKDSRFKKAFYGEQIPEFNTNKSQASTLTSLRNVIMHFNISDYQNKKNEYLESLIYWEQLLYCENCFIHTLEPITPTIKNILNQLKECYPQIYEMNDRYICDIFDSIALKNGLPVERLPKYWSIGRQIYNIQNSLH